MSEDIMATGDDTPVQRQYADLESYPIEGWRPDTGRISVPLISQVVGNLWQGGCIDNLQLPEDFQYVVSLYMWEEYKIPEWTTRITVKMYDSSGAVDDGLVRGLGSLVTTLAESGKTLVHCQAGLNRSSLITGASLIAQGFTGRGAIDLIRAQRSPACLCNKTFEQWLLNEAPDGNE